MNSLLRTTTQLPRVAALCRNGLAASSVKVRSHSASAPTPSKIVDKVDLQNFDPNNYKIEPRFITMDDTMEPYGDWKIAYEAERRAGNFALIRGIVCLSGTLAIFYYSGVADGCFMPNLDNLMEDTHPWEFDKEGRISV